jgi:hypothetical protein
MNMERLMEQELTGEIEVLEENQPHFHFIHNKSHHLASNPGCRSEKPATNRLSYGTVPFNFGLTPHHSICLVLTRSYCNIGLESIASSTLVQHLRGVLISSAGVPLYLNTPSYLMLQTVQET